MPLTLPQLDDRTWKDLVEESRALIPSLGPDWTNHNAADPGITLVELFAYMTETLLYRVNRVGDPQIRAFLKLINGPGWAPGSDLAEEVHSTIRELRRCHRAVSAHDFESLALSFNDELPSDERIGRAHCLPRRNLEGGGSAAESDTPGHVSLIIVPARRTRPSAALLGKVRRMLEPARLIATRIHVVAPRYVTVAFRITLVIGKDTAPELVRRSAFDALERYFDPLEGGPAGSGWPFGRSVYVSEIYAILARLPGVLYVTRTLEPESRRALDEIVVGPGDAGRNIRNRAGEMEAIALKPDELVAAWLDAADIDVTSQPL